MEINDRIADLIVKLGMNPNSFADAIGVKGTVIYNIIKGRRSKPSFEVLQKIFYAYSALNANWLLNGDGNVWKEDKKIVYDVKPSYVKVENRINVLFKLLAEEVGELPALFELEELVGSVIKENAEQKFEIVALREKQDQILEVIRKKLSLDI